MASPTLFGAIGGLLLLAASPCRGDIYSTSELFNEFDMCEAGYCHVVDLNNQGVVLATQFHVDTFGRLWFPDENYLGYHVVHGRGEENSTHVSDLNDAGDVLLWTDLRWDNPWHAITGYEILRTHNSSDISLWSWQFDTDGSLLASWGPVHTQLANTKGQFVETAPSERFANATRTLLFTPVPEPSSWLLLGTATFGLLGYVRSRGRRT